VVSSEAAQRAVLREEGVFGWWMAPDFRMSFWRPLSSLTHVLAHWLWPRSFVLAHAQSMLWLAALLAVLAVLYRRFHLPWVAHLALLLYAVDDARGWVLGWVANRNVLVAATLAFAAHDRARRDGWRPGRWLAPALFAAALLGGEAALGAVLSLLPMCATYPMDRLLVFAGVGAMATVALALARWREGGLALLARPRRLLATAVVLALVLVHVVLAPLLLPLRVLAVGFMAQMGDRLEASVPKDETVRGKSLVILSSAAEMTTFPPWMQRQVSGVPRPARMRVLASCFSKLSVSRPDATTLRVRPERGFLDNEWLRMVRGPSRPFRTGDEVVLSDVRVRVRSVTADGRPAEVDFTFGVPLEDPSLLWRRLEGGGTLVPWSPPAVGESEVLPSIAPR
jgi:hypothetical protein